MKRSDSKVTKKQDKTTGREAPRIVNPDAAGIDIGATEIYVAVRGDRDPQPVRHFPTFTQDLHRIADWLIACKVTTAAMESTGVYWLGLYQVLESRGIRVNLVNAKHAKNVPGRKTDVEDCQWLHTLHTYGLLRGSFRPEAEVCAVRSIYRHRTQLIESASCYVQHMQKALTQMNIQIHHVLSDLTGVSGLAILDKIIAGERDPVVLAHLRDRRVAADKQTVEKSLVGDWKDEHLFTLRQSLESYRFFQGKIDECDKQLHDLTSKLDSNASRDLPKDQEVGLKRKKRVPDPQVTGVSWEKELYRIFGVNIIAVPGISMATGLAFVSEVGADLSAFKNGHHFASWLRLSPANKISGGHILSSQTPKHKPRLSIALRMAAQSLFRCKCALGDQFRRMRAKLGAPKAITAMAHRLARILYVMITKRVEYSGTIINDNEVKRLRQKESWLRKQAAAIGMTLVPNQQLTNQVT
jgi:transposase